MGTVSGGTSGGAGGSSRGDVSSGDDVSWLDSTLGLDCGEILAEKKNQISCFLWGGHLLL